MTDLRKRLIDIEIEHNKRKLKEVDKSLAIADGFLIGAGLVLVALAVMTIAALLSTPA